MPDPTGQDRNRLSPNEAKHEAQFGARYTLNNVSVAFEQRTNNPKSGRLTMGEGANNVRESLLSALSRDSSFVINQGGKDPEVTYIGTDSGGIIEALNKIVDTSPEVQKAQKDLKTFREDRIREQNEAASALYDRAQEQGRADAAEVRRLQDEVKNS